MALEVLREVRLIVEADVGGDLCQGLTFEEADARYVDAPSDQVTVQRDPEPPRERPDQIVRTLRWSNPRRTDNEP